MTQVIFQKKFDFKVKRNDNSPLKLAGYNVNANDGLTAVERHRLLSSIIDEGVLPKYKVCEYLRYFISQGQFQKRMKNAVEKWEDDLEFVEYYQIDEQPSQNINNYSKYSGSNN